MESDAEDRELRNEVREWLLSHGRDWQAYDPEQLDHMTQHFKARRDGTYQQESAWQRFMDGFWNTLAVIIMLSASFGAILAFGWVIWELKT